MKICEQCGTKNKDNFNCCYNCGARLKKDDVIEEPTEDAAQDESNEIFNFETNEKDVMNSSDTDENYREPEYDDDIEEADDGDELFSYDEQEEEKLPSYKKTYDATLKSKKNRNSGESKSKKGPIIKTETVVKIFGIVLLIVFVAWGTVSCLNKVFNPTPPGPTQPTGTYHDPSKLYAEHYIYDNEKDSLGNKYYKITIVTNGENVLFMGESYKVENNQAFIVVSDAELYETYAPDGANKKDKYDAENIPVVITANGFDDYQFSITIKDVQAPAVPVTLLTPESTEATIYGNKTTVSFQTVNNATVYINNIDCTEKFFDAETGIFTYVLETPPNEEPYRYLVTIESPDYNTRTYEYTLTRSTEKDPNQKTTLDIDEFIFNADDDGLVTVTGSYTGEHDTLQFLGRNVQKNTNIETVSVTFDEEDDSKFTAVIKTTMLGWNEIEVVSREDLGLNKKIYVKNMSNKQGGFDSYSTSSWSCYNSYDSLSSSEATYNGQRFVIEGEITKVEKSSITGVAVTIKIKKEFSAGETDPEKLVYVELFTEDEKYKVGTNVKFFANRSGVHDKTPRFLSVKNYIK